MNDATAPGRKLIVEVPGHWSDLGPEERDAWLDEWLGPYRGPVTRLTKWRPSR